MTGVFYRPRVSLKYWTTRIVERFLWDLTLIEGLQEHYYFFHSVRSLVDSSCHYDKYQWNPSVDMWKLSTKTKLLKQYYWQICSISYQTHLSTTLAKSGPLDFPSQKSFLLFFAHKKGLGHMFQK